MTLFSKVTKVAIAIPVACFFTGSFQPARAQRSTSFLQTQGEIDLEVGPFAAVVDTPYSLSLNANALSGAPFLSVGEFSPGNDLSFFDFELTYFEIDDISFGSSLGFPDLPFTLLDESGNVITPASGTSVDSFEIDVPNISTDIGDLGLVLRLSIGDMPGTLQIDDFQLTGNVIGDQNWTIDGKPVFRFFQTQPPSSQPGAIKIVSSVPEPSTLLGLFAVSGLAGTVIRKQKQYN